MDTAKLFINGRSQALRLPKAYRFEGTEVFIKKVPQGVLLVAKDNQLWDAWEKNLHSFAPPLDVDREQAPQPRDGLDALFT